QEAGILTPAAAETALQKVLSHYGQPVEAATPGLIVPVDRDGVTEERAKTPEIGPYRPPDFHADTVAPGAVSGGSGTGHPKPCADTADRAGPSVAPDAPTVDEYYIHDQQLHAVLLRSGRLTPAQLDTAVREQQVTGHPLWRTVINLELLTRQEMTPLIKPHGAPAQEQAPASPPATAEAPGQALVPQPRRDLARHVIEVDETTTAVQIVNTIFEGAIQARATDIHIEPQVPRMRVRYRIDGMLFDVLTVPPALETSLISRIKVMAD